MLIDMQQVIDAFTMFHDFETADLLSARRDDVTPEDERTVSDLMVDQIEFADVIVLNKIDMVSKKDRTRILDLIRKLNHRAKIIESSYGKIDVKEIVNTGMVSVLHSAALPSCDTDTCPVQPRSRPDRLRLAPGPT